MALRRFRTILDVFSTFPWRQDVRASLQDEARNLSGRAHLLAAA